MYIDLIRRILEEAIETYAASSGMSVHEVRTTIREHIDNTAKEHEEDEPDIQYQNPLCRLGYLYRHATANATLFELVINNSGELLQLVRRSTDRRLSICAVGGGPGTELLGLAKFMMRRGRDYTKKITFTVLDVVPQWAETWQQLADAVEDELEKATAEDAATPPTIAPIFLPHDAMKADSYTDYAYQFRNTEVIVFNYLFSECKTRLADAKIAVKHLFDIARPGCVFVVIDRLERTTSFREDIVTLFHEIFSKEFKTHEHDGRLDDEEKTESMGKMLLDVLGYPRVKFFTPKYRYPTVFWFTVMKE